MINLLNFLLRVEKHRFGKFIPTFVDSFKKKYKKFFKKDTPITEQTFTPIIQEIKTFIGNFIFQIHLKFILLYKNKTV